ncbi:MULTISPECIES: HlyD family efflux transporter periplasmic adaptor subunit [unclassified Thioalkalivibrio]|uniref:HlyD family efflux transporter periplasmic adaptor subunit n=1 Tax=unclassified Thioalkalivibrio TaxID=2621013 RepID=UPI000382AB4A|nr:MULTISPECIES: HlyD family efflux transporter periplasmic adaptor subunit [unclassified Thioalkalivibrio]
MSQQEPVSQHILDAMADGVLVVDAAGMIRTLNPAAARILSLSPESTLGRSLAEVFLGESGYGEFVDVLLEAIYSGEMVPDRVVAVELGGETRSLKLTTSYLDEGAAGGERAVLAVFTDVTDLEAARRSEHALAEELRSKHRELQDAYVQVESSNEALQHVFRRTHRLRLAATVAVIGVFALAAYWAMPSLSLPDFGETTASRAAPDVVDPGVFEVQARSLESTTGFSGRFRPGDVITLVAPFESTVLSRHVEYGERVSEGDVLLELDPTEVRIRYRRARSDLADAEAEVESLEDWEQSRDMASARRSLRQAERSLNNDRRELDDVEHLFERGIVPERELRAAEDRVQEAEVRVEAAREDMAETQRRGGTRQLERARAEAENARAEYEQVRAQMEGKRVIAPVDGIVLAPIDDEQDGDRRVESGSRVNSGEALLAVGDLSSMEIEGSVDELDIHDVRVGQSARVRIARGGGEEFPARVSYVSSQAQESSGRGLPVFRLITRIDDLDAEALERIRVGMSASVDVVTQEEPDAVVIPHAFVERDGDEYWVWRQRDDGEPERIAVELGNSRFDGVQVSAGLEAGDRLIAPPGGGS